MKSKKQFVALMLKLDIRLKLIKGSEENYYKIRVIRKDRGKRTYYTDYHRDLEDGIAKPTLKEILNTLRLPIGCSKKLENIA